MGDKIVVDAVGEDVALMNKSFDEGLVEPDPEPVIPKPDPDPEPDPKPDADPEPDPEPIVTDPEPEPDPIVDPEPEPDPDPTPEPDEKDKTIEDLRKKLAEKEAVPKVEPEPEPEPEPALTLEEQDFIGELDLDELTRDPKEFNKLLNKVFTSGIETSRKVLGEGVLRSIPDIVRSNVTAITNLNKASAEFYDNNKDLVPFKKVVAAVFEEVASENPDKKYDEVLSLVGDETRKRLDLKKVAVADTKDKKASPNLPRKKGSAGKTGTKPSTEPLLDEIGEMNKTLGR